MKKNLLLTACLFFISLITYSQWIQTDGPYAKTSILAIFESKSKLYVGTNCGLHVNDSISSRWKYISNIDMGVYDQKGDSIFYGGLHSGVNLLILTDNNLVPKSKGPSFKINTIKSSDTCLFVGGETGGFAKSVGFSDIWNYYNDGLPTDTMYIPPKFGGGEYYVRYVYSIDLLENKLFCGTSKGVFKSEINNITWSESSIGLPKETVGLLKVLDDTIYACIDDDLYFSSDIGNSWSKSYTFPSTITSIEKLSGIFYITTKGNGIFKSKNFSSWTKFNSGLIEYNIKTIKLIDSVLVCGSSTNGFQYFNDNKWIPNNSGIICSTIRSLKSTNNSLIANDADYVYLSSNGKNWNDISPAGDKKYFGSVVTMGNTVFLTYKNDSWDQFIKYYNVENDSWENIINIPPYEGDDAYTMFVDGDILYAYENDKMYYTNNLGKDWSEISLPNQYCNSFYDFIIYNSQPFAAACGDRELVKLSNNSWVLTNDGLPTDKEVVALAHSSDALFAQVNAYGMYVSKNNGESWTKATNGLDTDWRIRSFAYYDKNIFVTTDKGIYYTDDYGQNWKILNEGLINVNTGSIVIFKDTLYVGTYGNGIWKHDIESIPLSISESNLNESLSIYPNPALDNLNIILTSNLSGEILIYDLMGRKLLSQTINSTENIDISGIPNGTYIVTLNLKDKIKTNKLIISR